MAKPKYTFDQKVEFLKLYRKQTGTTGILVAEEVAKWLNENLNLSPALLGVDFRRPADIREYFDRINERIRESVVIDDGTVIVMSTALVDIDYILDHCKTRKDFAKELQEINRRHLDIIETNQKLVSALQNEQKKSDEYRKRAEAAESGLEALEKEKKSETEKYKKKLAKEKKENARVRRIVRILMEYINRYITDPIIQKHVTEELMLLETDPSRKIELPSQIEELLGLTNLEEALMSNLGWNDRLFEDDAPVSDEDDDDDMGFDDEGEEDETDTEVPVVEPDKILTETEANALKVLEDLGRSD